ncbi:MAG TPA: DUF3017 domain-containing protein [Trebonia sp.]|nr:DUF3017 domain-containing protein [Trebonia sp.]
MTPETQQARVGYRRPQVRRPDGAATARSGALPGEAARTGQWGAVDRPSHAAPQAKAAAKRLSEDASIVRVIPLLAVLVVTVAGVYIAWHQGSTDAGEGGVVGGAALLVAAAARLLLPSRLAGLLAMRTRANDVVTLAIFGTGLLVVGLVLPR